MNQIVLFDGPQHQTMLPLTYLRSVAHCLVGMKTIKQKWAHLSLAEPVMIVPKYLSSLYPSEIPQGEKIYINSACLPSRDLLEGIERLKKNAFLKLNGEILVFKTSQSLHSLDEIKNFLSDKKGIDVKAKVLIYPEDILNESRSEFLIDYKVVVESRSSTVLDNSVRVRGKEVFIGSDVVAYDAILNSSEGPIFIDNDAEIMEGAVLKGPVYVGPGTKIHVGAKIYANTILGPECRIGGEVKRTTIFGYTNKGHDGYLGDSVLARWCNLGADTNNSNMKNTYGRVSLFDIQRNDFRKTERQFLGMILGDHTMSAIDTSFNTGTVSGIFCNVLDKTPERYIPSFSWGTKSRFKVEKALEIAQHAMGRRNQTLTEEYKDVVKYLFH